MAPINHPNIINAWLKTISNKLQIPKDCTVTPIVGDASIRKYYVLLNPTKNNEQLFIIMQTPKDNSLENFINITTYLKKLNANIPTIFDIHQYESYCYLLLSHLGNDLLYNIININNANNLYSIAWQTLANLQLDSHAKPYSNLPSMDRSYIKKNLLIFKEWYLQKHLKLNNLTYNLNCLENYFTNLFQEQPQVFVHVDYHSKNLILRNNKLGIIDFQDAMLGPITYDIVSLLQDAYLVWPEHLIETILFNYFNYIKIIKNLNTDNLTFQQFLRYFYLTGLQRHIKNLGVFARLKYFYKKNNYLQYIPNLLHYINNTCNKFKEPELAMIQDLLATSLCKQ